jgi:hypothetical protein
MLTIKKLLITTTLFLSTLTACGPGGFFSYYAKDNYYNFLDASLVGLEEENPLYALTSSGRVRTYEDRKAYFHERNKAFNIEEWHHYLEKKLSQKELEELLYGGNSTLMERYKKVDTKLNNRTFKAYLASIGNVNEKLIDKEQDAFLKLRYLFLNMRKAHYSGNYLKTLALYENHYGSLKEVSSIVHEWIDALRAGAMQHLGQMSESNLLYAKVLENKTNAYLGYYDFKINNDKEWEALLTKASDNEEKAKLYFLRALKWEGSPLHEHAAIAKIAPNSKWFERLTYMLMQDFQETAYQYERAENKEDKYVKEERKIYLLKEQRFLKTLNALEKPSFFSLYSTVYLNFLREKKLDEKELVPLQQLANNDEKSFVKILRYLNKATHVTEAKKETLFESLEQLSKELSPELTDSLFSYTALKVAPLYEDMSAKRIYAKIFADTSYFSQYHISRDAITADDFEAYVEEKNRNYFEEKLFRKSMKALPKNGVAETLAILSIKDGDFQKAQKYFNQVPHLNRSTKFNPFNVSLSGNNRKVKGKGYDQRKLVKTMLSIEESLKKNPNSAMDYFLLATGRYNTSWYGNFAYGGSIWHSTAGYEKEEAKHILKNAKEIEKLYEKALKYAQKDEFKAKIAYQLLKVKLNQEVLIPNLGSPWIAFGDEGWDGKSLKKEVSNSQVLKEAYSEYKKAYQNTKYGEEVIRSCVTFSYF